MIPVNGVSVRGDRFCFLVTHVMFEMFLFCSILPPLSVLLPVHPTISRNTIPLHFRFPSYLNIYTLYHSHIPTHPLSLSLSHTRTHTHTRARARAHMHTNTAPTPKSPNHHHALPAPPTAPQQQKQQQLTNRDYCSPPLLPWRQHQIVALSTYNPFLLFFFACAIDLCKPFTMQTSFIPVWCALNCFLLLFFPLQLLPLCWHSRTARVRVASLCLVCAELSFAFATFFPFLSGGAADPEVSFPLQLMHFFWRSLAWISSRRVQRPWVCLKGNQTGIKITLCKSGQVQRIRT